MEINSPDPIDPRERQFIELLENTGEELKSMSNVQAADGTPMLERLRIQQAQINQQDYIIRKLYNIIRLDYDLRV